MKLLICLLAAFAVFASISCREFADEDESFTGLDAYDMQGSFTSRIAVLKAKIERVCPGKSDDFEKVMTGLVQCRKKMDETKETMCSLSQKFSNQCTGPFIKFFEGCLPTSGKYIPGVAIEIFKKVENYLCQTDGEHIFELFNHCIANITPKTQRCLRTVAARAQDYETRGVFPTVQNLCEQFESMRPCMQSHLNGACGHPTTREMWLGIFDVAKSAVCVESLNEITSEYEIVEP